jgi:pyruvate,orthophosphate dikinase
VHPVLLALLFLLSPASFLLPPAFAQTPPPDPDAEANVRFGPLSLKSTIALSNLGIDTNVFNQADEEHPQSDFTMTFSPNTDVWLRMGRTWVTGTIQVDWVYYNKFASERSANSSFRVGAQRTFNRLAVNGNARRISTRDRPGYEIDARSQRYETSYDGEATLRVMSKTRVGATAWRRRTEFDETASFRAASLAEQLNRTSSGSGVVVRHDLTPLTSVSLDVTRERERFVFSQFRDSNSTRVLAGVSFQPLALISGTAAVGFRRFTPLPADVPPFRGAVTAVNLSYSLLGTTRLGVQANRDIQYSFEFTQPYYLETGVIEDDPFQVLDQAGVGKLIAMACDLGRKTRPDLKLGICGEHGGDPSAVAFCDRLGMNYVSCSPFRVPIARLAAAQAALAARGTMDRTRATV